MRIALRRQFYHETATYHMLGSSVIEFGWMDALSAPGPAIVIAEGLMMYLPEQDVKALIVRLQQRFGPGELAFDAFNRSTAARMRRHPSIRKTGAQIRCCARPEQPTAFCGISSRGAAMTQPPSARRWWHRLTQGLGASRAGAWIFARILHRLDRPILRLSRGRFCLTSLMSGLPIVLLTTTGAKSGQPRSLPLIALTDGPNIVLVASNYGQLRHPAWYHNLRAHPQATLSIQGRSGQYIAREVTGAERDQHWRRAVARYPGYAFYEGRTGGRRIPVMLLTPKAGIPKGLGKA